MAPAAPSRKAYSYLRFSTPEQAAGDSKRRQSDLAAKYAATHGLVLDDELTIEDLGVSAFRGRNASAEGELGAFLKAVEDGLVPRGSYLLVENLDRLSRDAIDEAQYLFLTIIRAGVTIVTLLDGKEFSRQTIKANPTEMLISMLVLMRGHEESATKSRRGKHNWLQKRVRAATDGTPMTHLTPAWIKLDRPRKEGGKPVLIPERVAILRRIFKWAAQGLGQHSIAMRLNAESVPTWGCAGRKPGTHWGRSYIAKTLENPAVVGTFIPHKESYDEAGKLHREPLEPIPDYFPAVISEDLFQQVQEAQKTRSPLRGRHTGKTLHNVFAGLLRCPVCTGTMTVVHKGPGGGSRKVVCTNARAGGGCAYHSIPYAPLEDAFLHDGDYLLANAPHAAHGDDFLLKASELEDSLREAEASIENLTVELAKRPSLAIREHLTMWEEERADLKARLDEVAKTLATGGKAQVERRCEELRKVLKAKPFNREQANGLLRGLAAGVTVKYDEGELVFVWNHGGDSRITYAYEWGKDVTVTPELEALSRRVQAESAVRSVEASKPRRGVPARRASRKSLRR